MTEGDTQIRIYEYTFTLCDLEENIIFLEMYNFGFKKVATY